MLPDLDPQLLELLAHHFQHLTTFPGDLVRARCLRPPAGIHLGREPAIFLHALQQRIQRARAHIVPMVRQLPQHPLADHLPFRGMMQHMHLPEGEQDFSIDQFEVHGGGSAAVREALR